jgi:hypothetical protein
MVQGLVSVPHCSSERREDFWRIRAILSSDLCGDPDFTVDSPVWDTYHRRHVLLDKRRKSKFLGDKDYNFGSPPQPWQQLPRTPPPPSPPTPHETRDDSENFVASIFHKVQMAHQ